jgi:hypothetical protein
MIDTFVASDALPDDAPTHAPSRTLYAWLLAGLLIFFGIAGISALVQNMPESQQDNSRIERLAREAGCANAIVVEFHPGLFRVDCPLED